MSSRNDARGRRARFASKPANDNDATSKRRRATARDVRRIFGKIDDETVAEILRTGSTLEDLREVCSWLVRQGDVMAWQGQTKTCGTAAILEFVTTGADLSAEKLVLSRGGKGSLKQAFRPT
jgi:hypothetical protein